MGNIILLTIAWLATSLFCCCFSDLDLDEIFEPKEWKRRTSCNWFGVVVITVFFNALFFPLAICYWFYVLCHI